MEDLYCFICKSVPKYPLVLPCCFKTACKDHKLVSCPSCCTEFTEALQPNKAGYHYFNSLMSVNCERCDQAVSTVSCHTCKASLCKECSNYIHAQGVYTQHVLSNCSQLMNHIDNLEICSAHKLPFKFFCGKEAQIICRRCKETHGGHKIQDIDEVMIEAIEKLMLKKEEIEKTLVEIKRCKEKFKETAEELIIGHKDCQEMITKTFSSVRQALEFKESDLLKEVENIYIRKSVEINNFSQSFGNNEIKLKEILGFIQTSTKLQASTMLSQLPYIDHIISQGLDIDPPHFSVKPALFPLKLDLSSIHSQITSISLSDSILSLNTLASNSSFPQPYNSPLLKSPKLFHKTPVKSLTTPIKSRSNSNESLRILEENPLETRVFLKKLQTSTAIQVSWNHPARPVPNLVYCLEYGVGAKLNSTEQFRPVYKGTAHTCIITDLLPKTSYRFRVAPVINEYKGDWSEIVTVNTLDAQKIDPASFAAHASIVNRAQERFIQFDKPGIILACNAYNFGKHWWEIKVIMNNNYSGESSVIRVGVSGNKSKIVNGVDVDCVGSRGSIKIKVMLDVEAGTLIVQSSTGNQETSIMLAEGPYIPAIQYKPNKFSNMALKLIADFDS